MAEKETKQIFKTMVPTDSGTIEKVDTIEHENKMWLVPNWLDQPGLKLTRPNRLILLDSLPHEKAQIAGCQYVLNTPLPKELFEMSPLTEKAKGFVVVDLPDFWFELPSEEPKDKH